MKPQMDTDGHRSAPRKLTDSDRRRFLDALDCADLEISDVEAGFIESTVDRANFTPTQRTRIDDMIERYGERIGF